MNSPLEMAIGNALDKRPSASSTLTGKGAESSLPASDEFGPSAAEQEQSAKCAKQRAKKPSVVGLVLESTFPFGKIKLVKGLEGSASELNDGSGYNRFVIGGVQVSFNKGYTPVVLEWKYYFFYDEKSRLCIRVLKTW